jgi:hypothetical protein
LTSSEVLYFLALLKGSLQPVAITQNHHFLQPNTWQYPNLQFQFTIKTQITITISLLHHQPICNAQIMQTPFTISNTPNLPTNPCPHHLVTTTAKSSSQTRSPHSPEATKQSFHHHKSIITIQSPNQQPFHCARSYQTRLNTQTAQARACTEPRTNPGRDDVADAKPIDVVVP